MTAGFNNSRFTRLAPIRFPVWRFAGALVALALLTGAGAPAALGQAKIKVQFLPSQTQTNAAARPQAVHPLDSTNTPVTGSFGYYFGTTAVNSAATQQVTVAFNTFSDLSSYVPTVNLRFGKSYSAGAVSCTESNNPSYPATAGSYPYIETCSVVITFTPLYPGGHKDAIFVLGTDGKTEISGEFLYGIGLAPQLMIQPGMTTSLQLPGSPYLYGSATDDTGTYYVYANSEFYTVRAGNPPQVALLATSVDRGYSLSIDGAGNLFDPGSGSSGSGYEFATPAGIAYDSSLCYTTIGDKGNNPVIVPYTYCYTNPATIAAGNLGTYYDADGGGEYTNVSQSNRSPQGLLVQGYSTQGEVTSPAPPPPSPPYLVAPAGGDSPIAYPLNNGNYSPSTIVVDSYENLFFLDGNHGMAVWCGWGINNLNNIGVSSAVLGSSNGCGGWGTNMVLLNQFTGNANMAVDAAETVYAGQNDMQMFSAANNYASPITSIGVSGGAGDTALAPDGTVYVESTSNLNIIDRSQGAINFGSNNGQTPNPYTMTVYNGGNQPLTISLIVPSGAGYTVQPTTTNGCTNGTVVAAGTICQLQVTFAPVHNGLLTGAIAITSNSLNNPVTVQSIALYAALSGIYVTAAPTPLAFGYVAPSGSTTLPVTVTNTSVGSNAVGYGSSTVISSGFTSTNPAFSASAGNCNMSLASGSQCQIQVTFNPGTEWTDSGTIGWTESIPGGPSQQVSITVTGTTVPTVTPYADSEAVHITDTLSLMPSTLLSDVEAIQITDQLSLVSSTLLPINETIHVSDAEDLGGNAFSNATTTTLSASQTPVTAGNGVTLAATVTELGSSAAATGGSVNLYEDGNLIQSGTAAAGIVTFASPALSLGSHTFQASYSGSGNLTSSTSGVVMVNVVTQTVLTVTARDSSRAFDSPNRAFTYIIANSTGGAVPTITGAPAFSTTATLNSMAGTYPITPSMGTLSAPTGYLFAFVNGTLTVNGGATQTITFLRLPNLPLTAAHSLAMTAHSTSGLPITYTVTGAATVFGSTVMVTGAGTVTVTASQPGNSTFAPATPVARSFTVVQ